MATQTPFLGLVLPAPEDRFDLEGHWNANSTILDTYLADLDTVILQISAAVGGLGKGLRLIGAVNHVNELPANPEEGDAYTVLYTGTSGTEPLGVEYAWVSYDDTLQWVPVGVDPSVFARQPDLEAEATARAAADTTQLAAITALIDNGDKNVLDLTQAQSQAGSGSLQFTVNSDLSITMTGQCGTSASFFSLQVTIPPGRYIFSGMPEDGGSDSFRMELRNNSAQGTLHANCDKAAGIEIVEQTGWSGYFNVRVGANYNFGSTGKTLKPMVCDKAYWAISTKYVPHK